jgi:hypothetical protein
LDETSLASMSMMSTTRASLGCGRDAHRALAAGVKNGGSSYFKTNV